MRSPVERDGLGYRWDIPRDGVTIRADRMVESGETLSAEVTFDRAPEGRLLVSRFNLLAAQTRKALATQLASNPRGAGVAWMDVLERFVEGVLELHREGPPFEVVGDRPLRPSPPALLAPFLYVGKPTILFGQGGIGKSSAIAAAAVVSVATGVPVLDAWRVETPGAVLILDWEGDGDDWNDAVVRLAAGMRMPAPTLHYRRMRGPLDAQVNEIAAFCDQHGVVLVVVDSVTWATRTSDRGSVDEPVKRMFDALRAIGRSSLLIDHKSKAAIADDETGSSPIGSIVKVNAARAVFEVRRSDDQDPDGTRHLALINHKQNPTSIQPPLGVAVRVVGGETLIRTEPVHLNDGAVAREANAAGVLHERIRDLLLVHRAGLTGPSIVGYLGLSGKDPLRQVEQAMERKRTVFGVAGTQRNTRRWYLHELRNDDPPEEPPLPTAPDAPRRGGPSVGARMASIFASDDDWMDELQ